MGLAQVEHESNRRPGGMEERDQQEEEKIERKGVERKRKLCLIGMGETVNVLSTVLGSNVKFKKMFF